jgi:hypothetical protein
MTILLGIEHPQSLSELSVVYSNQGLEYRKRKGVEFCDGGSIVL